MESKYIYFLEDTGVQSVYFVTKFEPTLILRLFQYQSLQAIYILFFDFDFKA